MKMIGLVALCLFSGAASALTPCISWAEMPLAARVGVGAPVEFSAQARVDPAHKLLRYEWRRNGRLLLSAKLRTYGIAATTLANAGSVTVTAVATCGSLTSVPVALDVVRGWAMLSGRVLPGEAALDTPSLTLCSGPVLAWTEVVANRREVRVHRMNGATPARVGNATLHARPGSNAGEPSLQCSEFGAVLNPAVAFSESAAAGRTIEVRRFDGAAWQAVGSPAATAGADARAPLLRTLGANERFVELQHLQSASVLAWREGDRPRQQTWTGNSWAGAQPTGEVLGGMDLTIDTALRGLAGRLFPPLLAWIDDVDFGLNRDRQSPRVESSLPGVWDAIGAAPATPAPLGTPLTMAGIGFGTENSRPRVALVWAEGTASYTLRSVTMASTDYEDAMNDSFNTNPWQPYAQPYSGAGLVALAFDGSPQEGACYPTTGPLSFTLALTDAASTRVLRADCRSGGAEWRGLHTALPVVAERLDLRMLDWQTPLVATVVNTAGGRKAAVWAYYP